MLRKAVSLLLVILMLLAPVPEAGASSFPKLNLALNPEIPAEQVVEDPTYGRIRPEYNRQTGKFEYFDFFVTATRAVTGIRYRTPLMWIKVGNYPKFYFDTTALANWRPTLYDSAGQAVTVPVNEILNYIIKINNYDAGIGKKTLNPNDFMQYAGTAYVRGVRKTGYPAELPKRLKPFYIS